jgi:hypothetical protein
MSVSLLVSSRLYLCELRVLLFLQIHKIFKFEWTFILLCRRNIRHSVLPLQPGPRPPLHALPITLICVTQWLAVARMDRTCVSLGNGAGLSRGSH